MNQQFVPLIKMAESLSNTTAAVDSTNKDKRPNSGSSSDKENNLNPDEMAEWERRLVEGMVMILIEYSFH